MTMIFVVLAAIPAEATQNLLHWKIAYTIGIVAGFTDFLDGYLARRFDLITDFGKLMDPLADKIFTVSGFVILSARGIVPAWVTILILTREFAVTGLRAMAANKGEVMAASGMGKFKTTLQMLVLAVGGAIWVDWLPDKTWWWTTMLCLIVVYTVYSGIVYFVKSRDLYIKEI